MSETDDKKLRTTKLTSTERNLTSDEERVRDWARRHTDKRRRGGPYGVFNGWIEMTDSRVIHAMSYALPRLFLVRQFVTMEGDELEDAIHRAMREAALRSTDDQRRG